MKVVSIAALAFFLGMFTQGQIRSTDTDSSERVEHAGRVNSALSERVPRSIVEQPLTVRSNSKPGDADLFLSADFAQIRKAAPSRLLKMENVEYPGTLDEYRWTFYGSSAFDILHAIDRVPNDWVIIGRDRNGDHLLERWLYVPPKGAFGAFRTNSQSGIGTPLAHATTTIGPVGGAYIVPSLRKRPPPERRGLIAANLPGGVPTALGVDPDGRYALYAGEETKTIYQVALIGGAVQAIADSVALPGLDGAGVNHIRFLHDSALGRVCLISYRASSDFGIMEDADNDGIFETFEDLDRHQARAIRQSVTVIDDYINY